MVTSFIYFSEKNLSRPPFRFLHDIVTQLIKKTGFFNGLFPAEMLDSKNVTDKDAKVKFLQVQMFENYLKIQHQFTEYNLEF